MGPARSGSVLLVEAYGELREVLTEVLEARGLRVAAFGSAGEALAAARQDVRVVLVGVNGYQRERGDDLEVLQRAGGGEVPIIALVSGDGGMRLAGVAHVLRKPVGEEALCAALEGCLEAAAAGPARPRPLAAGANQVRESAVSQPDWSASGLSGLPVPAGRCAP